MVERSPSSLLLAPFLILGVVFVRWAWAHSSPRSTVSYRDFRYVIPFMLQFWMFATPVVYPASLVPEKWRMLLLPQSDGGHDRRLSQPLFFSLNAAT